jgi:hypothetical protein
VEDQLADPGRRVDALLQAPKPDAFVTQVVDEGDEMGEGAAEPILMSPTVTRAFYRLKICSGLPGWGFKSLQGHLILKDFLAASGFTAA